MPDNLKLQTVYVPAAKKTEFILSDGEAHCWLDKQDNRIVLTPEELLQFAREAVQASETMSPEQFLKSKGIVL